MFTRVSTFFGGKCKPKNTSLATSSNNRKQPNRTTTTIYDKSSTSKTARYDRKKIECKVIFLDNSEQVFRMDKDCTAEDLMNQVVRTLDLVERDYFSLQYEFGNHMFWLDMSRPVRSQVKKNFNFFFKVKFYPYDPDELVEELTRYHFYLQARKDVKERRLCPPYHVCVELAALALQSELGDYEDLLDGEPDYVKNYKFIPKQTEQFEQHVCDKHKGLLSMTPGECEMNYLRIVKTINGYGLHKFSVTNILGIQHDLCIGSKGLTISRNNIDLETYFWEQLLLIAFKRRVVKFKVQNRNNKKKRKIILIAENSFISKDVWKLCIENHSFFRLLKSVKKEKKSGFFLAGETSHIYQGRTLYESMKIIRSSMRRKSFRRKSNRTATTDRKTSGYLRIGSRVLSKGYNGEYYHGQIVALSDKVYVKNDNGNTAAFSRDVEDAIIFDADPDPSEVTVGTRVIARWPGIDSFLPGTVEKIEGEANFRRFWIFFDDEDYHWNNIDQIRLLKPPLYFGPGSQYNKSLSLPSPLFNKVASNQPKDTQVNGAKASTPITADKSIENNNFNTSYSTIDVNSKNHSSAVATENFQPPTDKPEENSNPPRGEFSLTLQPAPAALRDESTSSNIATTQETIL